MLAEKTLIGVWTLFCLFRYGFLETVFSVLCSMHAVLRSLLFALVVQACIESQDPVIQSLGFQSLAHLCEADVIGNPDCVV